MSGRPLVKSLLPFSRPESPEQKPRGTPVDEEPAATPEAPQNIPLLIDLDRTLIRTDLLLETALAYVAASPHRVFYLLAWVCQGRAHLKRKLAESTDLDLDLIPVNEKVVDLATEAKRQGRAVYLVTASDALLANKIAARFPFFDGVISSDGVNNLKGARKAEVVGQRFPDGYDYVGDSAADLHVWRKARAVVVVEPAQATLRSVQALHKPTVVIEGKSRLRALIKASRLHQWAKNTLIFVPAILSGQIAVPSTFLSCALAFLALGLVALGTYLVNDLLDLAHDRKHWSKRSRPIASGDLSMGTATATAVIAIVSGLLISAGVNMGVFAGLAVYLVLTLAYSLHIKRLPILDVVVLATLFTLRLSIGIAAAKVFASPWLLVFSMFLFTSLSVAKRYTEIQRTAAKGDDLVSGRGYRVVDAPLVLGLGIATATASILILVLYLIFDAFNHQFYTDPNWLWFFPLVLFIWVSRVWLISQRGELNDDPVAFALKDRPSLALGGIMAAAFILAWLGAPL
jgi:4-hydroxybenzoate polyprenyltransferase/phosphoserine phosphatase